MKTVLYSRVSTSLQQNGLDSQRRALEDYCRMKGILEYEYYEDFAVSGAKSSRPQLDKLMKEVREGRVQSIIVYSFSRFARSTKFLLESLEEFGGLGVNFVSITENIDLSTPIGKAMFTIISAISTLEKDLVSERVKNGLVSARARGSRIGRPRTLSYDLIVKLKAEGYSYRKIAKMLGIGQGSITRALRKAALKQKDEIG